MVIGRAKTKCVSGETVGRYWILEIYQSRSFNITVINVIIDFFPSQTIWQISSVGKGVSPTNSRSQDLSQVWPEPWKHTITDDNIHPIQPSHAEDDRLHNSDFAMQQAKLARYQV